MNPTTAHVVRLAKQLEKTNPAVVTDALRRLKSGARRASATARRGNEVAESDVVQPQVSGWGVWAAQEAVRHARPDTTPHRDDVGVFGLAPVAYGNAQQTRINDPDDFPEPVLYAFGIGVIDSLLTYPRVTPLPAQQRLVDDVIADARRAGLNIPPFDLIFVESVHRRVQAGQAARYDYEDGRVRFEVVLDASRFPAELRETMYHECAHLHDYFVNRGRFDRVELERRAVRFASRMVGRGPF